MTDSYHVNRGGVPIESGQFLEDHPVWTADSWNDANVARIEHFHRRSSDHHPRTIARLLNDGEALYLRFDVIDRFVVARATADQQSVCLDSCVEFFVQPRGAAGYFNFEFNCGGTVLASYVLDPTRTPSGFARCEMLGAPALQQLSIAHSMPQIVDPEIATPTNWKLCCRIPLTIFNEHMGDLDFNSAQQWRGNFYKCADRSSHPHWASWSPIGAKLDFHDPSRFAPLIFA